MKNLTNPGRAMNDEKLTDLESLEMALRHLSRIEVGCYTTTARDAFQAAKAAMVKAISDLKGDLTP